MDGVEPFASMSNVYTNNRVMFHAAWDCKLIVRTYASCIQPGSKSGKSMVQL